LWTTRHQKNKNKVLGLGSIIVVFFNEKESKTLARGLCAASSLSDSSHTKLSPLSLYIARRIQKKHHQLTASFHWGVFVFVRVEKEVEKEEKEDDRFQQQQ
jgi:hypothetical protein